MIKNKGILRASILISSLGLVVQTNAHSLPNKEEQIERINELLGTTTKEDQLEEGAVYTENQQRRGCAMVATALSVSYYLHTHLQKLEQFGEHSWLEHFISLATGSFLMGGYYLKYKSPKEEFEYKSKQVDKKKYPLQYFLALVDDYFVGQRIKLVDVHKYSKKLNHGKGNRYEDKDLLCSPKGVYGLVDAHGELLEKGGLGLVKLLMAFGTLSVLIDHSGQLRTGLLKAMYKV